MSYVASNIVARACDAKLELKSGELATHVGCAFENWANSARKEIHPYFADEVEADIESVRKELAELGFTW